MRSQSQPLRLNTIALPAALIIGTLALFPAIAMSDDWIPEDLVIGISGVSYKDPEFISADDQVVFMDSNNGLWVADLNPATGFFNSASGFDYYLDQMGFPPSIPNGPEWTANMTTSAVLYTKIDQEGYLQLWRAARPFASPNLIQMTNESTHAIGPLGSRDTQHNGSGVVFIRKQAKLLEVVAGPIGNLQSAQTIPNAIPGTSTRWVYGLNMIVYQFQDTNTEYNQLALYNPLTGSSQVLTNDTEYKSDVWGFKAPEYNNRLLVGAHINDGGFAIYGNTGAPDGYWRRIATLRLPEDSPFQYLNSVEPVETTLMGGDTTYFTAQGWEQDPELAPDQSDVSIWVLGLGTDSTNRFVRRVDEGAVSGDRKRRWDPESYIGDSELFVYYNLYSGGGGFGELRRCTTGIPVGP